MSLLLPSSTPLYFCLFGGRFVAWGSQLGFSALVMHFQANLTALMWRRSGRVWTSFFQSRKSVCPILITLGQPDALIASERSWKIHRVLNFLIDFSTCAWTESADMNVCSCSKYRSSISWRRRLGALMTLANVLYSVQCLCLIAAVVTPDTPAMCLHSLRQ